MLNSAKIVNWSDAYRIGLTEIDDQHQALVDLINDLWAAIASNAPPEQSGKILERLEHYTITHFAAEETMMRTIGYPDFDSHQSAHRNFVARLQEQKLRHQRGEKLGLDILHFLRDWLVNHILVNDKAYATFYADQNKPTGFLGRFFSRLKSA
jgi:hemerythrin